MVALLRAVRDLEASSVFVATDSPPYIRSKQFAGYKGDRKRDDDAEMLMKKVHVTMPLVQELLDVLCIPFWAVDSFEYDDIAAWAVYNFGSRYDSIVAMTNDTDLYQLFDLEAFGGLYRNAQKGVYSREMYFKEFNLSRMAWVEYLAMTGTHNAVPGIEGVGPVTALKAIRDPATRRVVKDKHGRIIERNLPLIELPHADFPDDPGLRLNKHKFTMAAFVKFCLRYDIKVTANMVEGLQQIRFKE